MGRLKKNRECERDPDGEELTKNTFTIPVTLRLLNNT